MTLTQGIYNIIQPFRFRFRQLWKVGRRMDSLPPAVCAIILACMDQTDLRVGALKPTHVKSFIQLFLLLSFVKTIIARFLQIIIFCRFSFPPQR